MFSDLKSKLTPTKIIAGLLILIGMGAGYLSIFELPGNFCFVSLLSLAVCYLLYQNYTASNDNKANDEQLAKLDKYRLSTYGSPFPEGWYALCFSWEVKEGDIKEIEAFSKRFVVFRNKSSKIGILDAYCPHLGANLAVGGEIHGDCIACPFHKWEYDIEGHCTHIPYSTSNKIPSNANTRSYSGKEFCGMICIYWANIYDDNDKDKDTKRSKQQLQLQATPRYILPESDIILGKIVNNKMKYGGSFEGGLIRMHLQEFAENAADLRHFDPIHSNFMIPFTKYEIPLLARLGLGISHNPNLIFGVDNNIDNGKYDSKSFMYFLNSAVLQWHGKDIKGTEGNAKITFLGPGGMTFFTFRIPKIDGEIVMFHTHLPVDNGRKLNVRFHWYYSKNISYLLVLYVVGQWISQWQNDIDIWQNKIFLKKPCLIKGDGPIMKARQWFKQFYNNGNNNKIIEYEDTKSSDQ